MPPHPPHPKKQGSKLDLKSKASNLGLIFPSQDKWGLQLQAKIPDYKTDPQVKYQSKV